MSLYGNVNGKKIFNIPVEWVVTENIRVRANSLEEAVEFVLKNADFIPLGSDADYIDGTYKISADELDDGNAKTIVNNLKQFGYGEEEACEYDCVTSVVN